jgi:hypothetical protein
VGVQFGVRDGIHSEIEMERLVFVKLKSSVFGCYVPLCRMKKGSSVVEEVSAQTNVGKVETKHRSSAG